MRKLGFLMFVLPLLAGCTPPGGDGGSQPAEAAPQLEVDWHTALVGDVIEVELTDSNGYYRVERVELVGPSGRTYEAHELMRQTVRESTAAYGGAVGVGVGGGHVGGVGVGLGLSFPLTSPRRAPSATRTRARVRPPDPEDYRRTFEQWTIRFVLSDPSGATSYARIPAPGPRD